jgi:SAM-dependent methyltransferase
VVDERVYTLESSDRERERLALQAALLRPITERLLRSAGIGPGHRVLDAGCGAGHVGALAAELVGATGSVVGIDRDVTQVERARARWSGLRNVSFEVAELADPPPGPFDAVVGRLVLMYQPDMAACLASLARSVRPGGSVAFLETSLGRNAAPPTWPESGPLAERISELIQVGFRSTGTHVLAGLRLPSTMRAAGLEPQPPYESGSMIYEGRQAAVMQAAIFRSMLPALDAAGTDLSDLDVESLEDDLVAEQTVPRMVAVGPLIGVCARKPIAT